MRGLAWSVLSCGVCGPWGSDLDSVRLVCLDDCLALMVYHNIHTVVAHVTVPAPLSASGPCAEYPFNQSEDSVSNNIYFSFLPSLNGIEFIKKNS